MRGAARTEPRVMVGAPAGSMRRRVLGAFRRPAESAPRLPAGLCVTFAKRGSPLCLRAPSSSNSDGRS